MTRPPPTPPFFPTPPLSRPPPPPKNPAVPHEPAAPKQRVPLPREQHVPDLRPDDPSDHGREHDIGGVVFVHAAAPQIDLDCPAGHEEGDQDRKSTRLNSSHGYISYAVFCLKKKK